MQVLVPHSKEGTGESTFFEPQRETEQAKVTANKQAH